MALENEGNTQGDGSDASSKPRAGAATGGNQNTGSPKDDITGNQGGKDDGDSVPESLADYIVDLSELKDESGKPLRDGNGNALKMDEAHPLLAGARAWAQEHGISKQAFSKLASLEVQRQLAEANKFKIAIGNEKVKLGAKAQERIDAVGQGLIVRVGPELASAITPYLVSAKAVEAFERLLRTSSAPPLGGGDGSGGGKPDLSSMTTEERLHYARSQQGKK